MEIIGRDDDRKNVKLPPEDERQMACPGQGMGGETGRRICQTHRKILQASQHQIKFSKALVKSKNVPEPNHLYDYHISLAR